jgi:hypothetical protein
VYYENKYYGVARLVDTYANTKIKRSVDTKQLSEVELTNKAGYISASLSACKIRDEKKE